VIDLHLGSAPRGNTPAARSYGVVKLPTGLVTLSLLPLAYIELTV
jgi:hypothetical protein